MDNYDSKLKRDDLLGLLSSHDGLADILTEVINQVLEAQCTEPLKAAPYERSEEREAYPQWLPNSHVIHTRRPSELAGSSNTQW